MPISHLAGRGQSPSARPLYLVATGERGKSEWQSHERLTA
ncbi:hypothetical protein SAMN05421858_2325 [Haladaptatus litoreus]|uniref:Uncharacterized protein n=1 Tax=Haladaptatus litoreus TaxID=553468 RepID=A0A1N7B4D6_9EURY|nr:hypothetical protein SAMN05421858_2325 [Haladaptatus litoreus]